jgi:hypothetical protein
MNNDNSVFFQDFDSFVATRGNRPEFANHDAHVKWSKENECDWRELYNPGFSFLDDAGLKPFNGILAAFLAINDQQFKQHYLDRVDLVAMRFYKTYGRAPDFYDDRILIKTATLTEYYKALKEATDGRVDAKLPLQSLFCLIAMSSYCLNPQNSHFLSDVLIQWNEVTGSDPAVSARSLEAILVIDIRKPIYLYGFKVKGFQVAEGDEIPERIMTGLASNIQLLTNSRATFSSIKKKNPPGGF